MVIKISRKLAESCRTWGMKTLGCFRILQVAEDFAIMRSIIDAPRKYGLDIMETLAGTPEEFLAAIGIELPDWRESGQEEKIQGLN